MSTKEEDNWNVVRLLAKQDNVNLNVRGRLGYTVLMWATLKGNVDMVSQLLQYDTLDTTLKNLAGSTALDIANICGHETIANLLQDTDTSPKKKMKMTPISK
jgi:ankyrin repeat protein